MKKKILLMWFVVSYCCMCASSQTLDKKFASTNGPVFAVLQSGDTIYIGGSFTQVGYGVKGIARFKPGSTIPDTNFPELGQYYEVSTIEPDSANGYYLAGYFTEYNGKAITPASLLHILSDGSMDENFNNLIDFYGSIHALKKVGSRLYVGGSFSRIQNTDRENLVALDAATGILIQNWIPDAPNSTVEKINANDSLMFICGDFAYVGNNYLNNNFAALNTKTGKLIKTFPSFQSNVTTISLDSSTLYVGGNFEAAGYNKAGLGKARAFDAELNVSFPSTFGSARCILPDGKGGFYIGGDFNKVGDLGRNNLAHILPSGAIDLAFYVNINGSVLTMARDSTHLYIGGNFTVVNGATRNHIASLDLSTGNLTTFNPNANDVVYTIAVYEETVYLGGKFTKIKEKIRNYAGAIKVNNSLTPWVPNPNNYVYKIVLNNNGTSAYMGGEFSTIKSKNFPFLVKVNTTNGTAFTWKPMPDNIVTNLILKNNILYMKGIFNSVNSISRVNFAAIDTSLVYPTALKVDISNSYDDYPYNDMSIANNKLYVAGPFWKIQDSLRHGIARIDLTTGLVDQWNENRTIEPDYTIFTVFADNKNVVFGGDFSFLSVGSRKNLAAIDLSNKNYKVKPWQPDVAGFALYDRINDILPYGNDVFICGSFSYKPSGVNQTATVLNIMALDDSSGKVSHKFTQYPTFAPNKLLINNNKLFIAGPIYEIDSINGKTNIATRNNLASYNLSNYRLSSEIYDFNFYVSGIAVDHNRNMLVSGGFSLMKTVDRANLASINLKTGLPTDWNPTVNGNISSMAIKDSTLFVGGNFYALGTNNQYRDNLAAINIKTGEALTNWIANTGYIVKTLAIKDSTIYVGGLFNNIKGKARNYAAALSTENAALRVWNPNPDGPVFTILPLNNSIYLCGSFTTLKGSPRQYLARVNNTTGGLLSWNPKPDGIPYSIINSGNKIFVAGGFQNISSKTRYALACFDTSTNTITSFDSKINGYSPTISSLAAFERVIFTGFANYPVTIGDSIRGSLTGIDTTSKSALAFNPMPDFSFETNYQNTLATGKNKLFVGGNWSKMESHPSPSNFAVFTLEPLNQTSALSFTNLQPKSVTIHFTPGSGEHRLVVIAQGMQPVVPADGSNYTAKSAYKKGDSTGFQSYVVYNGDDSSATITNLLPNIGYTVSVIEYNGSGSGCDYLNTLPLTGTFQTPSTITQPVAKKDSKAKIAPVAHVEIYPNPANNECNITFDASMVQNYTVDISDVKGRTIIRKNTRSVNGINNLKLDIHNLASGSYIVNLINEKGEQQSLKLIKQ